MKTRKIVNLLLLVLLTVFIIFFGFAVIVYTSNKPPVDEMTRAMETLAEAKGKLAGKYAGETLKQAESYYNQAINEWKLQNSKFFVFRDYSLTSELAARSKDRSLIALDETGKSKIKLKQNAENKLITLSQQINHFETFYKSLALSSSTHKIFNSGKTSFLEAQIEFNKQDYMKSLRLIFKAEENVLRASKLAHFKLSDFYKDYPVWKKNTHLAVNLSQKGQTVFLIDKMGASLIVLKSGKEIKTFPVEFGNNWMGDKSMVGDKATPEGIYKVQAKKDNSKTKYYKALLLDYPNKDDQKRYKEMVRAGKISASTGIGGLIEIHGEGGKGIHWTNGCIALENSDMEMVYKLSVVNTPVIIVGSRQPLEEYLN